MNKEVLAIGNHEFMLTINYKALSNIETRLGVPIATFFSEITQQNGLIPIAQLGVVFSELLKASGEKGYTFDEFVDLLDELQAQDDTVYDIAYTERDGFDSDEYDERLTVPFLINQKIIQLLSYHLLPRAKKK